MDKLVSTVGGMLGLLCSHVFSFGPVGRVLFDREPPQDNAQPVWRLGTERRFRGKDWEGAPQLVENEDSDYKENRTETWKALRLQP